MTNNQPVIDHTVLKELKEKAEMHKKSGQYQEAKSILEILKTLESKYYGSPSKNTQKELDSVYRVEAAANKKASKSKKGVIPLLSKPNIPVIVLALTFFFALSMSPAYSQSADDYFNKGREYDDKHDIDRAIEAFTQAIRLNPNHLGAYYFRGISYLYDKKDNDKAIADFTQVIRLDPKVDTTYILRAKSYSNRKAGEDIDKAFADYTQAIQLNPKNAEAYCGRSGLYYLRGDNKNVITDANEAIRLDPKNDQAYGFRGMAYLKLEDYDRAIADFDTALRLNPNKSSFYEEEISKTREEQRRNKQWQANNKPGLLDRAATAISGFFQSPQSNNSKPSLLDRARSAVSAFINPSQSNNSQQQSNNSQLRANSGNTQQKQQTTPSKTEKLTYYINGNAKTANVVFLGYVEKRFSLDAGGNIVMYSRFQNVEGNWTRWEYEEIIKKQDGSINGVEDIAFLLNELSFYNATEETIDGMQLISIWQKYDDSFFGTAVNFLGIDFDNDCVYTKEKVYERKW